MLNKHHRQQGRGSLAQLGEHLPYKQRVTGSSPVTSTCISFWCRNAGVAELADAQDLKSCCSDTVPVRFRSPAFIERTLDKSVIIDEKKLIEYVCVAQLDRALGYGPRCRGFESSRARMKKEQDVSLTPFLVFQHVKVQI